MLREGFATPGLGQAAHVYTFTTSSITESSLLTNDVQNTTRYPVHVSLITHNISKIIVRVARDPVDLTAINAPVFADPDSHHGNSRLFCLVGGGYSSMLVDVRVTIGDEYGVVGVSRPVTAVRREHVQSHIVDGASRVRAAQLLGEGDGVQYALFVCVLVQVKADRRRVTVRHQPDPRAAAGEVEAVNDMPCQLHGHVELLLYGPRGVEDEHHVPSTGTSWWD